MTGFAPLILATNSQTRVKMLQDAGVCFDLKKPMTDEEAIKADLFASGASPRAVVDALAETKSITTSYVYPEALVIGADQMLIKDDKVYSKAHGRDEAEETLRELSDGEHQLLSSAVVCQNGQAVWRHTAVAKMTMRPLSDEFIAQYLDTLGNDAFWSVGCYQFEGIGAQLFTKVDGDHFTILGLPLLPLLDFLRRRKIMPL